MYIKIDECEVEGATDSEGEERRDADAGTEAAQQSNEKAELRQHFLWLVVLMRVVDFDMHVFEDGESTEWRR